MRTIDRLKHEALEGCTWRNHKMGRFEKNRYWPSVATATCKVCGMSVAVNAHPQANQIDIGGDAIAVNCKEA